LAGANLIYGLGMLESGVTFDYGQLLMDHEFAQLIKFAVAGVRVDDESLMIDDIHAVGSHGDFLSLDSNYKHMPSQSQPKLLDRRVSAESAARGGTDLYARATAAACRILETHEPEPLPDDVVERLRAIVEETERQLGVEPARVAF